MLLFIRSAVFFITCLFVLGGGGLVAEASHTWGSYHWARKASPFSLKLGDNVTSVWDGSLALASGDWNVSSVLNTVVVPGLTNPKNCRATVGRVEVCNNKYGNNGWLGIASIWASGSHITQGTVKANDTYFNTARYNTSAWRNFVMCQEIGHTLGLDHQDENFANPNLGTCMDYTNDPTANQHPNQHDYDMLAAIYAHLDTGTTVGQSAANGKGDVDHNDRGTWGKAIRTSSDGQASLYVKEFKDKEKIFTFVIWADEEGKKQ